MLCPRCNGPTHVTETRADKQFVRRHRRCGYRRGETIVSCGWQFWTMEIPVGARVSFELEASVTPMGLKAEVKRK